MIAKLFKDINTNAFATTLTFNVMAAGKQEDLLFNGLVKSGRNNIDSQITSSLHPEANIFTLTLIPQGIKVSPITIEYCGTWSDFLGKLESKLIELNRMESSLGLNITFKLEDKPKLINFIKSEDKLHKFEQVIQSTDHEYAWINKLMEDVRNYDNEENIRKLGDYIYDIKVDRK